MTEGRGRWLYWLGAALLAVAVAKIPLSGLDIWWHLRTGEALALTPGWLATDPFSWAAEGAPWPYKDIGADLLLYLGHRLLGDASLSLWPALAVLGIGAAFVPTKLDVERGLGWAWSALLLAAVVVASQHRLHARPMLFSHVAFAWLLVWLPRLEQHARRAVTAVALLLWLWAWLHRGALVGVAAVWAWSLAMAVAWLVVGARKQARSPAGQRAPWPAPPHAPWPSLLAAVAGSVGLLATPNGAAIVTTVVAALGRHDYVDAVDEWAPITPLTLLREHGTWFVLLLVATVSAVAVVRRQLSDHDRVASPSPAHTPGAALPVAASPSDALAMTALALGLSVIACGASRWIPYAALAAGHAVVTTWRALPSDHRLIPPPSARRFALAAAALCLVWVAARGGVAAPGTLATNRYPTAALAFARAHDLPPRAVNAYDVGGYLLWQGRPWLRTEIDGRADMVFAPALFRAILRSHSDPRAFAARRRIDHVSWVLGQNRPGDQRFAFLTRDRRWCLAHWSAAARIWLARSSHPALCETLAYRVFTGPALDATAFRVGRQQNRPLQRRAAAELARMIAAAPDDPRPRIAQVVLHHARGERRKRDALLSELVARFGDDPGVLALLRRLRSRAK